MTGRDEHSPANPAGAAEDAAHEAALDSLAQRRQSYWAIVRRQYRKSATGMVALAIFLLLIFVALLAPLLANEVPIVAKYKGELYFPALPTYLDAFPVPTTLVDWLRKLKIGGGNPFSNSYPALGDRTWKETIANDFSGERGDWYLPPPVFFSFKEIHEFKKTYGHVTVWGAKPGERSTHWLGTDGQGRDVLARLIHGTIISLSVGVVAVSIYTLIGVLLGLMAGYFGGWVDMLLSRIVEVVICFPTFFLIITVMAFLPRSIYNIMIVIGLTSWTGIFRLMRGEILKVKELDYCTASRALGSSPWRTIFRHLFPNAVSPVFVSATFGVAAAILTENALSFLGFGVAPPTASWGEIVAQGREYVGEGLFHLTIVPGMAIFLTVTVLNLMGQSLRDAMDPRLRR